MKLKIENIKWDTEIDGNILSPEELNLPSIVIINEDISDSEIADKLSNEYGFCVVSFSVPIYMEE